MGRPFSDITLYTPIPHRVGTPGYWEVTSLENFVRDLYVQKMNGYKPPKTSRITIQPAFHGIWNRTWKSGSIVSIAPFYSHNEYALLDKHGKYKYILDLIQRVTLQLSEEYKWDRTVFEQAYNEVIESNFDFQIKYPAKMSRDKKKRANLIIEKDESITSVYVNIERNDSTIKSKLFDKKNIWWYDCAYILARHGKWLDKDKFGIGYSKGKIEAWYSIEKKEVVLLENGNRVSEIDFGKYFDLG
jgi:hypothetical protein